MSKLELLQVEHDKVAFETKNVDGANSNLKRELEEKNRESVPLSLCPGTMKELLSLCPEKLHCPVPLEMLNHT